MADVPTAIKTRTGLFGGSFNPLHNGHIAVAQRILEAASLDEVWFMVSPQNPLKDKGALLDDDLRLALVVEALRGHEHLVASDYEFGLPRPSYTWNTLCALNRDYPSREFSLIIGADNWATFGRWYRSADILSVCKIIVYPRQGSNVSTDSLPPGVTIVDAGLCNVSSTMIRQLARSGSDISCFVPQSILPLVKQYYGASNA